MANVRKEQKRENELSEKVWSVAGRSDSKIQFLLSTLPEDVVRRFLFDDVARFSITRSDQARTICELLKSKHILDPTVSTICDGCACVGGNAIFFDLFFAHTTCVELDPLRTALLRSNLLSNNPTSFVLYVNYCFFFLQVFFFE